MGWHGLFYIKNINNATIIRNYNINKYIRVPFLLRLVLPKYSDDAHQCGGCSALLLMFVQFLSDVVFVFWLRVVLACECAMCEFYFPVIFLLLWPDLVCTVWYFYEWLCGTVFLALFLFSTSRQPTGPIHPPRRWVQSDRTVKLNNLNLVSRSMMTPRPHTRPQSDAGAQRQLYPL
jgi:hypothetical protein